MNIKDRINKECIDLDLKSTNKDDLLKELIELLYKNDIIDNKEEFLKDVYMREIVGPTSIGNGIAIPHGKSKYVKEVSMAIGKIKGSVEWNDINNFTVSFIILFDSYTVINGSGNIVSEGEVLELEKEETIYIQKGVEYTISGDIELLKSYV